jgi:DNA-binding transcriptional regulator LsrR (DeoR family)
MVRAATMYYDQGATMEMIARRLGVSRSSVSRLLKRARETGLVEITIHLPGSESAGVARRLAARFGVASHIVPVVRGASEAEVLDQVARAAGRLLTALLQPGQTVGVAWGVTTAAVARNTAAHPISGLTLVQLNGSTTVASSGLDYAGDILSRLAAAFDASVLAFPVPAFFDYEETRRAMWRERSVRRVLTAQAGAALALFSVGAPGGEVRSHVYVGGYLDASDRAALKRDGVVGDVCTVFLRADGTFAGIGLNQRASGPTPSQLAAIPQRVCVVAGRHKAVALLAALRAGVVTHLVVDEGTAQALDALL